MALGETQVVTLHTRWSCKVFAGFGAIPFGYSVEGSPHHVMEAFMDFSSRHPFMKFSPDFPPETVAVNNL